jgi:hypothetical protein
LTGAGARIRVPSAVGLPNSLALLNLRDGLVFTATRVWSRPPFFG